MAPWHSHWTRGTRTGIRSLGPNYSAWTIQRELFSLDDEAFEVFGFGEGERHGVVAGLV